MAVHEGEFVSILGPSGCGKSTLLMAVGGLLPISGGSIEIDRDAVTGPRRDTGVVFQSPVLMPWRTIEKKRAVPDRKPRAPRGRTIRTGSRRYSR